LQGFGSITPCQLVTTAFPELRRLELVHMRLTSEDLTNLSACSQLSGLTLSYCQIPPPASASESSPLTSLTNLRQLDVKFTRTSVAKGLTQLTNLGLLSRQDSMETVALVLGGMSNLQQLTLQTTGNLLGDGGYLHQAVVPIFARLRSLHLERVLLYNRELGALLTHAGQLTRLSCAGMYVYPGDDSSLPACNWQELYVGGGMQDAQNLAVLPLRSLTRLSSAEGIQLPSACPCLTFTTGSMLQKALTNLESCPAWQQSGPGVHIIFRSLGEREALHHLVSPLPLLSNRQVQLSLRAPHFVVGEAVALELGRALSASLTNLHLEKYRLSASFWPAVWGHLPGLQSLSLSDGMTEQVNREDVASFCTSAPRPLQLRLGEDLYAQLHTLATPLVTITHLDA
jgi:hypothetical protein